MGKREEKQEHINWATWSMKCRGEGEKKGGASMKQFGGRGKAVHSQATPHIAMHRHPTRPPHHNPTAPAFKDKPNPPWPPALRRRSSACNLLWKEDTADEQRPKEKARFDRFRLH